MLAASNVTHGMLMTMATAVSAGVVLIVIARRQRLPVIVLLLLGGVLLGPAVWGDLAPVQPERLGDGLLVFVAMAIGLILFEGGLTLDLRGYRSAPGMIRRLLTLGVIVTWLGSAGVIWLVTGLPLEQAVIAGSLVIVTGPTVIGPLLKRIRVTSRLHSILHWEGVLIDPIGVFIALLCFEWLGHGTGAAALVTLLVRVSWGMAVGIVGGWLLTTLVRRRFVPTEMLNVFALGFAVLVFGVAESVQPEAGLLSMTVAGFYFGLTGQAQLKQVRQFKAEITDLLIGTLFILLAARLSFAQFRDFGWQGVLLVAAVMLVIRPLGVALCAWRTDLSRRERAFLSWVAPRGIVAASMASLFAISMDQLGTFEDPRFVESFTYSVIVATIVLQGSSAGWLARMLGLQRQEPTGWLIVGAHAFSRRIGQFLERDGTVPVVLVDTNARAIREAQTAGLVGIAGDALDVSLHERFGLQNVGNVLALTDNEDLNVRVCAAWGELVGTTRVFRGNPAGIGLAETRRADAAGRMVWSRLPRMSQIAAELGRGEAELIEGAASDEALTGAGRPLLTLRGEAVEFDPSIEEGEVAAEGARTLFLARRSDHLLRSLRPALIGPAHSADLRTLFGELVDRIVREHPRLPRDEMVEELLERQASFPMGLGQGVAVPHAYSPVLDARVCAIASLAEGVDFEAHDGEPARLVFLLLSPPGDPEGHLATLAEIARLVSDASVRAALMNATTHREVLGIVRELGRD
ncbi:MAG: cation:proton antiporter domain-containing protein [Planctomycetota bacterium]